MQADFSRSEGVVAWLCFIFHVKGSSEKRGKAGVVELLQHYDTLYFTLEDAFHLTTLHIIHFTIQYTTLWIT